MQLVVLLALLGGIAVALQSPMASLLSQRLGILESIFIVHIGGALLTAIPLLVFRGGNLGAWRSVPWYTLLAGAFGLVAIAAVSSAIPRLGAAASVMFFVAAQLSLSALLDHWGYLGAAVRPLDLPRVAGMALLFLGAWLMVR
ncbi:MAG: DMT family transporter [Chloroflexota bacterium]|nr:DMT family transporter [Chloroflexota bacterium]